MIWTMRQKPKEKQDIARQHLNLEKWMSLENATELGETSSYTIRKKSNQTISIWWIANNEDINCKRRILCVIILFHHIFYVCVIRLSCVYVVTSS